MHPRVPDNNAGANCRTRNPRTTSSRYVNPKAIDRFVFRVFGAAALVGAIVTVLFAIETKGGVLEELSP